jgi:hypothetical protein
MAKTESTKYVILRNHGGVRNYFATDAAKPAFTPSGGDQQIKVGGVRFGVTLPSWRHHVLNGINATTPLSATLSEVTNNRPAFLGLAVQEYEAYGNGVMESFYTIAGGGDSHIDAIKHINTGSTADNQALVRARAAVKSRQQHMSGFTFLGELKETIQMLRRPADALLRSTSEYLTTLRKRKGGIRRGNADAKRKALVDIASGTWLEVSFGWKPLIADVKDIAETLARWQTEKSRHDNVRGYGEFTTAETYNTFNVAIAPNIWCKGQTVRKTRHQVIYRVRVAANDTHAPEGSLARLGELSGFRPEDFIPSVYQLIPYSFLVDYFTNLGDIVEAACTSVSDVRWVNRSEIKTTTHRCDLELYPVNQFPNTRYIAYTTPAEGAIGGVTSSLKSVERNGQSSIGIPALEFSLPGSNSMKWNNILALLGAQNRSTLRF